MTIALLSAAYFALAPSSFVRYGRGAGATCEASGLCYVTAMGAGDKTGVDWSNAYADLPSSLTRGVTYFLAGSTTSYAKHLFNDPDSDKKTITIYKAVDCGAARYKTTVPYCPGGSAPLYPPGHGPQTVSGWDSAYGTNNAIWTEPPLADPQARTSAGSFWNFCSDYYTIDGITGSTQPTSVGGQGFVLSTQNRTGEVHFAGCGASFNGLTDIILDHVELAGTGPMPYYPVAVNEGCSYDGTNATIPISASLYAVVGDRIAGWNKRNGIVFLAKQVSSISPTQVVVPVPTDPCPTLAYVALDFYVGGGLGVRDAANPAATVTNLTIQNSYFHDTGGQIGIYNGYNIKILHNYFARNRSTPTQHASIIQLDESSNSLVSGPVTVAYNFILDPVGTGVIEHLGQPVGCRISCGTINGLYVYGNIVTCEPNAPPYKCGTGQGTVSDNAGENNVQNAAFYNNTIANGASPGGLYLLSRGSTGGVAENNLYYNLGPINSVKMQGPNGFVHDYNTLLNSVEAYGTKPCNGHEVCISSGAEDPFVNDAAYDFHLRPDLNLKSRSGESLARGIALPDSAPPGCQVGVSCYNIDMDGNTRGANSNMERGAYEFTKHPPTANPH